MKLLDDSVFVCDIFMDLAKLFDTINHDLIIAKLEAYGFSISFLRYVHSYLNQLLQRTGVNSSFILWKDIIASVLEGSILDPF